MTSEGFAVQHDHKEGRKSRCQAMISPRAVTGSRSPDVCRTASVSVAWFVLALGAVSAVAEEFNYPLSVAVDRAGAIYVADRKLPGVWRVDGDRLGVVFRGSKKFRTPLAAVRCVALDRKGRLLAGDSATRDVYRFDAKGTPHPLTSQGKPLGQIGIPMAIAVEVDGNLLVSDFETHRIVRISPDGGDVRPFASVNAPRGLCYDSRNRLWAISGRKLVRFSPKGESETVVDDGVFLFPHAVAVRDDGTAYVSDGYAKTIWRIAPGQKPDKWVSGSPLDNPVGLELHQGKLFVVDPRAKAIFEIDEKGSLRRHDVANGR